MTLKYIGDGAWLPGIPARDLTDDEVKALGGEQTLIATGLYEATAENPRGRQKAAELPQGDGE